MIFLTSGSPCPTHDSTAPLGHHEYGLEFLSGATPSSPPSRCPPCHPQAVTAKVLLASYPPEASFQVAAPPCLQCLCELEWTINRASFDHFHAEKQLVAFAFPPFTRSTKAMVPACMFALFPPPRVPMRPSFCTLVWECCYFSLLPSGTDPFIFPKPPRRCLTRC